MISMGDKKVEENKSGKKVATVSNNGPLFDYRRDKVCD